jgi:hypothetical protein
MRLSLDLDFPRISRETMGWPSELKSPRGSLRFWESNTISTVPRDPHPLARWNGLMDCLRGICLSWLKNFTSLAKAVTAGPNPTQKYPKITGPDTI